MRYLLNSSEEVYAKLRRRPVFLFLDFDGTLAPIAETPGKAVIPGKTRELLRRLADERRCKVAVISGRALKDLKRRLGLRGVIYSGNHGLETEGMRAGAVRQISRRFRPALEKIGNELRKGLSSVRGVLIEDKGLSLSLHYRMADKKDIPVIKAHFRKTVASYLLHRRINVLAGKMVFEVRPAQEWDKGKVVLWLLKRYRSILNGKKPLPVYVGDDTTDEDAFKALADKGMSIYVGAPKPSYAQYYLKNTGEVAEFLRMILENTRAEDHARRNKRKTAL